MRHKPQFRSLHHIALDEAFKNEQHPFRIAIVCAMWMTGFDVPSLSHLYLDKPLKAHTLMQAIARANRVHEGKNNGLIVDYIAIRNFLYSDETGLPADMYTGNEVTEKVTVVFEHVFRVYPKVPSPYYPPAVAV